MSTRLFLGPCAAFRSKIGSIIFESSTFHKPRNRGTSSEPHQGLCG